ncbi:uncharacterized protein LOC102805215 [Saccoglossus kowalevskii]|uniref:Uncharacterized protein LOC102805215 n=1 Tax=Saccoglossus kowalevskii TaxID=10224 RepID=A0ABM0LY76_SACKO|nr:PREDICTED: uncharacterized protein LOC102805215 [Saccoglossus kowalevskii]
MDHWKWRLLSIILVMLLIIKIVFAIIQVVIFVGCMITDGATTVNCRNFTLIPYRVYIVPIAPASTVFVGALWIVVTLQLEQSFPTFHDTRRILTKKLFFYKDSFIVTCLIVYYIIVFCSDPTRPGASDYIVLPVELLITTMLMYVLNFRRAPSMEDKTNYRGVYGIYVTILVSWAAHNFFHVLEDTIYVGLNIYTFSGKKILHHQKAWFSINLLFLVIAGTFRYLLGNFYLRKLSCCLKNKEYLILRDEDDDLRLPYIPYADINDVL